MKYYAGLDVAMKETSICIMREDGKIMQQSQTQTDPKAINESLMQGGYELEKVGLESGSLSNYLTKGLRDLGCPAISIDSRKMAAILSVTVNKTDKNDARGIADAMRCNHYKEAQVRSDENEALSILLNARATLVNSRVGLKNSIRGYLKSYGIRLGTMSHKKFSIYVRSYYPEILGKAAEGIESLLKNYEAHCQEIDKIEDSLKEICKQDQIAQLLMTAPGVGMIVALTYKTDMGDPQRFERSESVGAYYGMAPRQYSSGETVRQGRISKCGARNVRTLLNEAAVTLLTRCKLWSPLKAWGLKLMKKKGLKKAAMAVGRKLAVILHRMMVTGELFRYSKQAA
jgi:transposase